MGQAHNGVDLIREDREASLRKWKEEHGGEQRMGQGREGKQAEAMLLCALHLEPLTLHLDPFILFHSSRAF